jgi:integrase
MAGFPDPYALPWPAWRYEHQAALRAKLLDARYAPSTANRYLGAVRGCLKAAWRLGLVDGDHLARVADVPPVRGSRLPAGRELEGPEVARLFAACDTATARGAQAAALLALLLGAGLRLHEPLSLTLGDLDGESIRVIGKGNRERKVELAHGFARYLAPWLELRGREEGPLLCPVHRSGKLRVQRMSTRAAAKLLDLVARKAGVAGLQSHDCRRTLATALLDAKADLLTVKGILGHANVQTTARYDQRGDRAQREAMRTLRLAPEEP